MTATRNSRSLLGFAFCFLMVWTLWAWRKGNLTPLRISGQKMLLYAWMAALPLSYIAMEAALPPVWLFIIGFALLTYVVTDGFDLGVGMLCFFAAYGKGMNGRRSSGTPPLSFLPTKISRMIM